MAGLFNFKLSFFRPTLPYSSSSRGRSQVRSCVKSKSPAAGQITSHGAGDRSRFSSQFESGHRLWGQFKGQRSHYRSQISDQTTRVRSECIQFRSQTQCQATGHGCVTVRWSHPVTGNQSSHHSRAGSGRVVDPRSDHRTRVISTMLEDVSHGLPWCLRAREASSS